MTVCTRSRIFVRTSKKIAWVSKTAKLKSGDDGSVKTEPRKINVCVGWLCEKNAQKKTLRQKKDSALHRGNRIHEAQTRVTTLLAGLEEARYR